MSGTSPLFTFQATCPELGPDRDRLLADLRSKEWLETNGLGGWAGSSLAGINTRRYHGLLVAATAPPAGRMVLLSKFEETIFAGASSAFLSSNDYPGTVHPGGYLALKSYAQNPFPSFDYAVLGRTIRKSVCAIHGENTTLVSYELIESLDRSGCADPVTLELRPLVAGRDYHSLTRSNPYIRQDASWDGESLHLPIYDGVPHLYLQLVTAQFRPDPKWYFNFRYLAEAERGLDCEEDLFTPGALSVALEPGKPAIVMVSTSPCGGRNAAGTLASEKARRRKLLPADPLAPDWVHELHLAADQFLAERRGDLQTIVAGFHWFTDWGRDTMIALPGLCLATGKLDQAKNIFRAFAQSASEGMIPNRFPDKGDQPEYNTIDATLWFFIALWKYFERSKDLNFIRDEMYPVLKDICAWHLRGTRYDIRVDTDGLLGGGMPGAQLTWMDVKIGDWVVTPRMGKPVEICALWFNALEIMAQFAALLGKQNEARTWKERSAHAQERFRELFWNSEKGCLFDVIDGDATDPSIRPNQIFALSLPFALLPEEMGLKVLETVERELLTPFGLRSLARGEPGYTPYYRGSPAQRDAGYHRGTVWSYLLGPYLTAAIRYRGAQGRLQALELLERFAPHLREAGIGTISEIFDAEPPYTPRGCIAQAWSVGEMLRVYYEDISGSADRALKNGVPTGAAGRELTV